MYIGRLVFASKLRLLFVYVATEEMKFVGASILLDENSLFSLNMSLAEIQASNQYADFCLLYLLYSEVTRQEK